MVFSHFLRVKDSPFRYESIGFNGKEFDTYKVGTVADSCSTMHKIHSMEFTLEDFSCEYLKPSAIKVLEETIKELNIWRDIYNNGVNNEKYGNYPKHNKEAWNQMIQLLPSSYNQKRTVQLNYAVAQRIYYARRNHKLKEWHILCKAFTELPYFEELCMNKYSGNTEFICISGQARHGKDTTAALLKECLMGRGAKVLIVHYADLLKFICKTFFGWNGEKDKEGRDLLQHVGTDLIRAENPDYWVKFVADLIRMLPDTYDFVIVPDTRFPNEIKVLKDEGFNVTHIEVYRPNFDNGLTEEQKNHPSERAMDGVPHDFLVNNTTKEELYKQVDAITSSLFGELSLDFSMTNIMNED